MHEMEPERAKLELADLELMEQSLELGADPAEMELAGLDVMEDLGQMEMEGRSHSPRTGIFKV